MITKINEFKLYLESKKVNENTSKLDALKQFMQNKLQEQYPDSTVDEIYRNINAGWVAVVKTDADEDEMREYLDEIGFFSEIFDRSTETYYGKVVDIYTQEQETDDFYDFNTLILNLDLDGVNGEEYDDSVLVEEMEELGWTTQTAPHSLSFVRDNITVTIHSPDMNYDYRGGEIDVPTTNVLSKNGLKKLI